ncbi:MAG TPA: single-stranded DNA-binding protein [Syntrophales bacterium]|jgi:single-strand DNA-binding protein|nr:single-stranded DNA-binding protein [Syntrophorhabdaceae bacterium]HPN09717.1 single-stranded DNA-binding protein [Syntrophales bacterium]HQB14960.1 single-stranded DNA-binding protein [Syntrophales bacterium]HQM82245.1 single-stranded DNA-binding protein [Syntrophorhabdaceae bacterium]
MVNKVQLIGRLGKDPEVRFLPDGTQVAGFSLATDESYKDRSGQKVQKTEWHRIVLFGRLAEIAGQYLQKGRLVFLEGKIQTRSWEDKEGGKHSVTEILARDLKMLGSGNGDGATRGSQPQAAPAADPHPVGGDAPGYDDDIPF